MKKSVQGSVPALFLDRDGVINKKIDGDYVRDLDTFEFLPRVYDAFRIFSNHFARIFIVTNQQGIGKGLMSHADLHRVHTYLRDKVETQGGKIDSIYYAHQLASENSPYRKPGTGMPERAKLEYPEIDLAASTIVGDSITDMEMGTKLNMNRIFIGAPEGIPASEYDKIYALLYDFALTLKSNN